MVETSCLPRKIVIGDRTARLRPPTVRQAVEIMHVLQHLEDPSDEELLFELLSSLDWIGTADILVHLRGQLNHEPVKFSRFLQDVLLQGYDPEEQTKKSSKEDESEDNQADWKLLISQYCRAYPGKDAYEVYSEVPFPFFMEMLPEARRETAKRHINSALEAGAGFGGGEKAMKKWQKQAGFKTKEEVLAESVTDISEEQAKRNMEILAKMRNSNEQ